MCTLSVSNVIYLKFSHGAAFYTLNGKNVNLMLELLVISILIVLQREQSEEKAKEAEDMIHKLKKQKMVSKLALML